MDEGLRRIPIFPVIGVSGFRIHIAMATWLGTNIDSWDEVGAPCFAGDVYGRQ